MIFKEWARVLFESSYSLNASNSKKLVFGISPFQLTKKLRKHDSELNIDFDFVMKIVDTKYGNSISIFGEEIDVFFAELLKIRDVRTNGIGKILIATKYYDLKQGPDSFYEFVDKNGRKIFGIYEDSIHMIRNFKFHIDMMRKSMAGVHWLRNLITIIEKYMNYQQTFNCYLKDGKDILSNAHIFNEMSDDKEKLNILEMINVFYELIYTMILHVNNING